MHNFRELKIWQRSMDFAEKLYKAVSVFPAEERLGLIFQVKKCAVSIPSNISEGSGRATNAQFRYFPEISMGSCNEVITQIELAGRFGFIKDTECIHLVDEAVQIYKMILGFYNSLK